MKQNERCPLCYGELEARDVAPCFDCGDEPRELDECRQGRHKYFEYEIFPGVAAVLCDFCDADFASYDPSYFGLPAGTRLGFGKMRLIREVVQPTIGKDKFCPNCGRRLAFLKFVAKAREANEGNSSSVPSVKSVVKESES